MHTHTHTVQGARDIAVKKIDKIPFPHGIYILVVKAEIRK